MCLCCLSFVTYCFQQKNNYRKRKMEEQQNSRCPHHPTEFINNFCRRRQCLVGLCATCICDHTEMHHRLHTLPAYENISATCQKTSGMLEEELNKLEKKNQKLGKINNQFQQKDVKMKEVLQKGRKEFIDIVNRHFDDLQTKYRQTIAEEKVKLGLQNQDKFSQLKQGIEKQVEILSSSKQELSHFKSPILIKKVHTELIPKTAELLEFLEAQMNKIHTFNFHVGVNHRILPEIRLLIEKFLPLEFVIPLKREVKCFGERRNNSVAGFHSPNQILKRSIVKTTTTQAKPLIYRDLLRGSRMSSPINKCSSILINYQNKAEKQNKGFLLKSCKPSGFASTH